MSTLSIKSEPSISREREGGGKAQESRKVEIKLGVM
jgi:hypothetical protein